MTDTKHQNFQDHVLRNKNLFQFKPTMDSSQMMTLLRLLGENPTAKQLEHWVKQVDRDGTGQLTVPDALLLFPRVR